MTADAPTLFTRRIATLVLLIGMSGTLGACDSLRVGRIEPIVLPQSRATPAPAPEVIADDTSRRIRILPGRPAAAVERVTPTAPSGTGVQGPALEISVENVPVPAFINSVFGESLKVPFEIDPRVMQKNDQITLRTGGQRPAAEVLAIARQTLAAYGIEVVQANSVYRVVPSEALLSQTPRLLRSRAQADVPVDLRPVFQYVEVKNVKMPELRGWLSEAYGQKLRIIQLNEFNSMLIMGLPEDIRAGLEAIRLLDQPRLAGRRSLRIEPVYWAVDRLALKLIEVLRIEGYNATLGSQLTTAINLLPIEQTNALLIFATEQAQLDHVAAWSRDLDQPSQADPLKRLFFYQVKNTNAEQVSQVLAQVIEGILPPAAGGAVTGGGATTTPAPAPTAGIGSVAAPPPSSAPSARGSGSRRLVVDVTRNAIIFQGTAEEFAQVRQLLETLDQPTREALIEVTVAEVTLDNTTNLGVEWALNLAGLRGNRVGVGTLGGLGIGDGGLNISVLNSSGDTRLLINALASSNKAQILSAPRLVARSGGEARIQVGTEVPLLTSQTTSPQQTGGNTGILQSIQYRNTGVLLTVKPIIHGSRRIELDIAQEVSEATQNRTSDLNTPVISNRKVNTQLSLADGATVIIGGLIKSTQSAGVSGIPGLRDVPVVGQLFRTNTDVLNRTELIILITPYVITNDEEAGAVTDAFRRQLTGDWVKTD
jgi:general secretion pathway protein D